MPIDQLTTRRRLKAIVPAAMTGTVVESTGTTVVVAGLPAPIGATVAIHRAGHTTLRAEVIGFRTGQTILFPLENVRGVKPGDTVSLLHSTHDIRVGDFLLGSVIDDRGCSISSANDTKPLHAFANYGELDADPPAATSRPPINAIMRTGIKAIDTMLTCGQGQRVGIFSTAGVGKSTLLGMLARGADCDVNVIALIGERGREVNEFIQTQIPPEIRRRSVVVVATSDQPAIARLRAAQAAMAVAEYFRDQGRHVLLLMDSLTRFATAAREVAIAAGEPPADRGYPARVFAMLPRLIERAGRGPLGSVTAFYTVLMENEDAEVPVAEAARGYLDGHIMLSRALASTGIFPAIDVTNSVSRVMRATVGRDHLHSADRLRAALGMYRQHEELVTLGAYRSGSNPKLDSAIKVQAAAREVFQQDPDQSADWCQSLNALHQLADMIPR